MYAELEISNDAEVSRDELKKVLETNGFSIEENENSIICSIDATKYFSVERFSRIASKFCCSKKAWVVSIMKMKRNTYVHHWMYDFEKANYAQNYFSTILPNQETGNLFDEMIQLMAYKEEMDKKELEAS